MSSVLSGLFSRSTSKSKAGVTADSRAALYRSIPALAPALQYIRESGELLPEVIHAELLPEISPLESCLGRAISESRFDGEIRQPYAYPHEQIALYMALRACEVLNANDPWWMEWSTSGRDFITPSEHRIAGRPANSAEEVVRMVWIKTLFRAALALPIGYLVSHTSWRVKRDGMAWNPAEQDMAEYRQTHDAHPEVFVMRSIIDARTVSHAAFRRLFPESLIGIPGLSFALADFFSSAPTPSNPLYLAWHNAMHFFFYERTYRRLPFWWVTLINHHFCRSETYRPISCVVLDTSGETDWAPPDRSVQPQSPAASPPDRNSTSGDPSSDVVPVGSPSRLADSTFTHNGAAAPPTGPSTSPLPGVQPDTGLSPIAEIPPSHVSPDTERGATPADGIQTVFDVQPEVSARYSHRPASATEPPALAELTLLALADFSDRVSRNLVKVNCKGAVLQKHDGRVYLVYPLFFRQLSEFLGRPEASPDALQQVFTQDGLLVSEEGQIWEHHFEIRPPGASRRLGKLRALPLSDLGAELLYPQAGAVADNDSLVPLGTPEAANA
ncbi:MAG: hypothetical protein EA417_06960 [Gammaproteobacteria bacterium]|nr:MAG: hypothetical protein EA417_06960 [Gammaproteobacteria bacterium]